jgi:hypothetical protein
LLKFEFENYELKLLENSLKNKIKKRVSVLVGRRLAFSPQSQAGPASLALVRPCARARAAVHWTELTPRTAPACVLSPNPRARDAAWPRRTGGRGWWLTARSEPPHLDGNASRVAPDRALTPAPTPSSPTRSPFLNAAPAPLPPRPPSPALPFRPFHFTASRYILPQASSPSGAACTHRNRPW